MPLALLVATSAGASGAPAPRSSAAKAAFGLDAPSYPEVSGMAPSSSTGVDLKAAGFSVRTSPSGQTAVVDGSMANDGAVSAANPSFVDLAWKSYSKSAGYTVVRDDTPLAELPAGSSSFRDTHVTPGARYQYRIVPELVGNHARARTFGLQVTIPAPAKGESDLSAMRDSAMSRAKDAAVAATTTLTWTTFIPDKYINQPIPHACQYWGTKYVYGGDNRGFDWRNQKYRTSASARINWRTRHVDGYVSVRPTHVYRKSDKKLVAQKTATDKYMKVRQLGAGSNYVDIRMVTHATNPFCSGIARVKGAIDGALQFHLTKSGNWEIHSGTVRQMPNHYIYIYNSGRVTDVYKSKYASPLCLVGSATCTVRDLTGHTGHFK